MPELYEYEAVAGRREIPTGETAGGRRWLKLSDGFKGYIELAA